MREAMRRLDPDVFRHSPPDRPHGSHRLNQVEGFLRRTLPVLRPFDNPWPDLHDHYERRDLDRELFPASPNVHDLPVRMKLRINDVITWMNSGLDVAEVSANEILCPNHRPLSRP
jgi:asparagine synthase (glutamine-hydrolysing)